MFILVCFLFRTLFPDIRDFVRPPVVKPGHRRPVHHFLLESEWKSDTGALAGVEWPNIHELVVSRGNQ